MKYKVQIGKRILEAEEGEKLLNVLRLAGLAPSAPCGGNGQCGKCTVTVQGETVLACQYRVASDLAVEAVQRESTRILTEGKALPFTVNQERPGFGAAFDVGTTTLVCFLLSDRGETLASESELNPQAPFGADVVTRIQHALHGEQEALTESIRRGMAELLLACCRKSGVAAEEIAVISVVGNPCMQQLFMGISPKNLTAPPFTPVLTHSQVLAASDYFPECPNAGLLVVPDIAGYVGADTMGCILAQGLYASRDTLLLVDIGTNGEMVLAHKGKLIACATAAGPALEGANISCGMRGSAGAIDRVWMEQGKIRCSVIGGGKAVGICGSGLIDAVAVLLESGLINKRGRITNGSERIFLTESICLTQEDIRQVQMAKGAIASGILLMAQYASIQVCEIEKVILAGAFGTFLNPDNACRIGLIPEELKGKVTAAGNIAGSGAKMLALDKSLLPLTDQLLTEITALELAKQPQFQRTFALQMLFREA